MESMTLDSSYFKIFHIAAGAGNKKTAGRITAATAVHNFR
jgi:hypothetical protein